MKTGRDGYPNPPRQLYSHCPFWNGDFVSVNSYRPALEDVLVYDPTKSQLNVKATLAKDRETYLRLFASDILGDEDIADEAIKDEVFTLAPLQEGKFNFRETDQSPKSSWLKCE